MAGKRGSCFFFVSLWKGGDFNVKIKKDELLALTSLQVSRTLLRGWGFCFYSVPLDKLGSSAGKVKKLHVLLMERK